MPNQRIIARYINNMAAYKYRTVIRVDELHLKSGVCVITLQVGGPQAEIEPCIVTQAVYGYFI